MVRRGVAKFAEHILILLNDAVSYSHLKRENFKVKLTATKYLSVSQPQHLNSRN